MKIQIFIQTYIKTNFNQMEKIMNNKRNDNKDDLSEFKIKDLLNSVFSEFL